MNVISMIKKMRMLRNRRGFEVMSETSGKLIIIGLTVVIIILIAVNIIITMKSASDFESCQKSISIAQKQYGSLLNSKYHLECRASHLIITPNDAEREATAIGRPDMLAEGLKSILTGEMVRCWRMVGKGEFNPYGHELGTSMCLICAVIDFAQWKDLGGGSSEQELALTDFHEFIEKESAKIEGADRQYSDFLPGGWDDEGRVHDTIDMSKTYVVYWQSDRFLNAPLPQSIHLLPYDEVIEGHCEFIVN